MTSYTGVSLQQVTNGGTVYIRQYTVESSSPLGFAPSLDELLDHIVAAEESRANSWKREPHTILAVGWLRFGKADLRPVTIQHLQKVEDTNYVI